MAGKGQYGGLDCMWLVVNSVIKKLKLAVEELCLYDTDYIKARSRHNNKVFCAVDVWYHWLLSNLFYTTSKLLACYILVCL